MKGKKRGEKASVAVAAAVLCGLALLVVQGMRLRRVELSMHAPVDPPKNAFAHHACDEKCEAAWTAHVKKVQAKLAAEHKKPSASPTVPLATLKLVSFKSRSPLVQHAHWNQHSTIKTRPRSYLQRLRAHPKKRVEQVHGLKQPSLRMQYFDPRPARHALKAPVRKPEHGKLEIAKAILKEKPVTP